MSRPTPEYMGQRLQDGQAQALSALYSAVAAAVETDPSSVPCVGPNGVWWTSSHPAAVRHAKAACQDCPLLKMCGSYARKFSESSGVWGARHHGSTRYEQTEITLEGVTK